MRARAPGALVRRDGGRLIVEPSERSGLTAWLKSIAPWDEDFPDVDSSLAPLDRPDP